MSQKSIGRYRMTWIRSFLITVTIVLAIFLAIFLYVLELTKQEEFDRNYSESQFLRNVLDDKFRSVAYLAADMLYRPASLFPQVEDESIFESGNSYRLVSELQSHQVSHSEIEDIFVYYPQTNAIIGTYGVRKADAYYYLQNGSAKGYEYWKEQLLKLSPNGYFLYRPDNETGNPMQLMLCNTLTRDANQSCRIFLKIRQSAIQAVLAQANSNTIHQFAALVDENGQVYSSYGDIEIFQRSGPLSQSGQYNGYNVTVLPSLPSVLRYITISDMGQVQQLSSRILIFLVAGVLISGLASILAAFYFSARNSKPVSRLLNRLPGSEQEGGDAFDYIGRTIDGLLQSNSSIAEQLERQQRITASSFLPLVFNGEQHDESFLTSFAAIYGVDFAFPFYGVLVVRFSDESSAAGSINDIMEWVLQYKSEHFDVTCGLVDGYAVCLMNWDSEETDTQDAPMFHFSGALCDWMPTQGLRFRIGVGGLYQKLSNIHLSYSEALYVLDKYQQQLCFYDICPHKLGDDTNGTVYYEFQRRILERDYETAYQSLHELLEERLVNCSPATYKYRKSALLQLVHEALRREISGKEYADLVEQQGTKLLFAESTAQQLEKNLGEVFGILIELTTQPQDAERSIAVKARSIIDHSYADPTLGLSSIASQLNVTGPYLSRAFKRECELGISEYISKVRIAHAKELMLRGDMSVKAVALRVGFSSDVNFIRVFKKYENTTPGRFTST